MSNGQGNGVIRHLPTIITAVSLALLFWVFASVQDLSVSVARQTVQIEGLREILDQRISTIETRLERLEEPRR